MKSFIFKSEKPHVVINDGHTDSPAFILDDAQIDEIITKISELGEIVRKQRIAEEECRRREEEEQRRREEEERRRREEEQKRQEALAKQVAARSERITCEIIESRETTATTIRVSEIEDSSVKKAWPFFTDNPYRILSVSVKATTEEANSSLDKIKKLARLNAIGSFKGSFELSGLEKPVRDLSIVQNALTLLKNKNHKWFWFADQDACIAWQNEEYRKELTRDGMEFGTYDLFLSNYIYALMFDFSFLQPTLWKTVFVFYKHMCGENIHVHIKSRFNESELIDLKIRDSVRSFKAEIFKPLEALCETDDVKLILRLYSILKDVTDENLNHLTKSVITKLTKWFTAKEEAVCSFVSKCNEDREIDESEAREIKRMGAAYLQEVDIVIDDVLAAVKHENVRHEMIKESYRHATWQLMFGLHKAGDKDMSIAYANKCYPYCNEGDKQKIRNTFGFSAIKGADRDATHAEWDLMGDNYYEGKNGYKQDYHEAFSWYEKAAEAGNKYSQNSLGICYREGNGTYQSDYQAAKWFEKAYENGNSDGAYNLAVCYATGNGRTQNKMKAVELYLEAAKMGHPQAADAGKALLDLIQLERKLHRLTQHEHYDLGYQIPIGETILVEVTLNYSANVYLMDNDDYDKYRECENFSYYGGRATQSPYRLKIPHSGFWHLVIDNGDEDMTGIITSVHTRTLRF